MKTSIYICHHKATYFLQSKELIPLHVGKAISFNDIGCPGDDTGDHISSRNPFYCELTGHYWIWKNDLQSDIIGLMHYRRHLNLSSKQSYPEDQWGCISGEQTGTDYTQKYGLDSELILKYMDNADVILPKPWDVLSAGSKDNYEHYEKSTHLNIEDYQAALNILIKKHPDFSQAVNTYNKSRYGYYNNIFIMKRKAFEDYSEWLFSILFDLEDSIDLSGYDQQQSRVFGHISERLLGIYFTYMMNTGKLKVTHAQRIFATEGGFNGHLKPAFYSNNIPLVVCFDNNYAHSGGALLSSIIKNSSPSFNYDILIFEDNVSNSNKLRLINMVKHLPNFALRFFDVNTFTEIKKAHTRAHFSPATYARLFIPALFEQQEKVIFIDADTVVTRDVATLFDIDLGHHLVAAVKDIIMEAYIRTHMFTDEKTGFLPVQEYLTEYLEIKSVDDYFQAGLIIFNLQLMRKEETFRKLVSKMSLKPYWFLDQDIMNCVFQGRVLYLPMNWNVLHGNGDSETLFPKLKFSTYIQYLDARRDPYMVHFAGGNKPWSEPAIDFSDLYWMALRDTPWYEQYFALAQKKMLKIKENTPPPSKEAVFRNTARKLLGNVFPPGTVRRQRIAKFYLMLISTIHKLKI